MRIDEEGVSQTSSTLRSRCLSFLRDQLNFYRIHVLYFTFTPLIFSAIFYASNGETHISYIDSLFNCVSAACVCGLATVDLSSLTPWQQTILFIQMCTGNPIVISWIVVFARRRLFMQQCEEIVERARAAKSPSYTRPGGRQFPPRFIRRLFGQDDSDSGSPDRRGRSHSPVKKERSDGSGSRKLRADMIRRMDEAPKPVNPSGWISTALASSPPEWSQEPAPIGRAPAEDPVEKDRSEPPISPKSIITGSEDPQPVHRDFARVMSIEHVAIPRTQTIEFAPEPLKPRRASVAVSMRRAPTVPEQSLSRLSSRGSEEDRGTLRRSSTYADSTRSASYNTSGAQHSGFGFFPLPHQALGSFLDRVFPGLKRKLTRSLTMPRTHTIAAQAGAPAAGGARLVPYISFDAIVGHNSNFHELTSEQLEELGGVEYRGLTALLWLIPLYTIGILLLTFIIIAPYMTYVTQWQPIFVPPEQHRPINQSWFTLFQVVSAFTNTGMSLVDQSMIPFQRAYPMIIFLSYLILAGNTAYPVFFRFLIWLCTKVTPKRSSLLNALYFLLDHPRRCYIYLFPSHQTWFLFIVVICLNVTDWLFFLILDIGNEEIEALPVGVRLLAGVLQSAAIRCSGFAIVTIQDLAPAVKVAYVIMMYISVYPIAMSVRSTNVYEDKSLGIYEEEEQPPDEEEAKLASTEGRRMAVWGRYLAMHVRHQLSFDMWWLAMALFIVCIIERTELSKTDGLFDIFTIIFELVSAYGGVGLSLGLRSANYSTSGAFRTLSKLVVCFVMLRGRHRGLPVAIDRAVVLPFEFKKDPELSNLDMPRVPTAVSTSARGQPEASPTDIRKRTI